MRSERYLVFAPNADFDIRFCINEMKKLDGQGDTKTYYVPFSLRIAIESNPPAYFVTIMFRKGYSAAGNVCNLLLIMKKHLKDLSTP